ncbi:preprotein translocase subunit YidC [Mycoplasmopsis californica]|uniref:Preprotein translocase subunit YidC n=1 Tax=Mycoplasmopsis californica TaxID=2113 RepID=A0A059XQ88_9BACT|nr:membrane protein insertase YidC [Mycoplasmopsis californica]AIA29190.1 preprotein translocase subunit YidC [Mycoplasmopsis californica]
MENRSSKFDYFKQNQSKKSSNNKKAIWNKVWLVIKIILYVLLFGLTLTGCIQTTVVKSSTFTGAGTEFYSSENKISPTVATFKQKKSTPDDKNLKQGQYYEIYYSPETNYHLSYKKHADTINELRNQANNLSKDGNPAYGSGIKNYYTSAIQYLDQNDKFTNIAESNKTEAPIINAGTNKNLFKTSASSYNSIYEKYSEIKVLDQDFKFDEMFDLKDGVYHIKDDALTWSDKNNAKITKKASLHTVDNTLNKDDNKTFARDILEFLYRETFIKKSNYYASKFTELGTSYEKIMGEILKGDKKTLSKDEFNLLSNYNRVLQGYIKLTTPAEYSVVESEVDKMFLAQRDKNGEIVKNSAGKTQYTKILRENAQIGIARTNFNKILFAANEPQIPFTSFKSTLSYGPFFSFIIYPIAAITLSARENLPSAGGWSSILVIILAVVITRLIALAITWKATMSQSMQEELRAKKAKIDAKYAEFKNNKEMKARHQQEVADLYKKNGISPLDAILSLIVSFPIFIAMWRVIQSVPEIKSTNWLWIDFAATSWRRLITHGEWWYLILLTVTIGTQVLSMIVPRLLNKRKTKHLTIEQKQAMRKSDRMQWTVMAVFMFITVIFTAGVQVYWIFSNIWSILQSIGIHFFKKSQFYQRKYNKKLKT